MSEEAVREKVAEACRVLGMLGLATGITGHVSARVEASDEMLIRCRGEDEWGVRYTQAEAIRRVDFDGQGPGVDEQHERPLELPIHGEIYKARPDVKAVVHAHPESVLLCGAAELPLKAVYGAFDPSGLGLVLKGIPIFPRAVLINSPALGQQLVQAMGAADVCIMRGHGIATVGRTIEEAALRAISLERLARINWELARQGRVVEIRDEDQQFFQALFDRSAAGPILARGDEWNWRHYVRLTEDSQGASRNAGS